MEKQNAQYTTELEIVRDDVAGCGDQRLNILVIQNAAFGHLQNHVASSLVHF